MFGIKKRVTRVSKIELSEKLSRAKKKSGKKTNLDGGDGTEHNQEGIKKKRIHGRVVQFHGVEFKPEESDAQLKIALDARPEKVKGVHGESENTE